MFNERVQSRAEAKAATRQRVLSAADRRFRASGFAATTIRAIADDADVSVGTVAAVGDKDALLVAIVDEWIGAVHAERSRDRHSLSSKSSLSPADARERLVAIVEPFIAYFLLDSDLSREFAAVLARGRHRSETFARLADELTDDFARILRAVGHPAPDGAARVLYLAYIGVLFTSSGGQFDETQARGRFAEAADILIGETGRS